MSTQQRNIKLYGLYTMFAEPLFWGPILVTSMMSLGGMSLPDIYMMESAMVCIVLMLEIPSGALSDMIGPKYTILTGRMILIGAYTSFACMNGPTMVWIGNILWAIGASLESGSNESILYENIEGKEGHSFKKVLGKSIGYRLAAIAAGSLLVTPLSMLSLRTPIVLSVPFVCIPFFAILLFKEERIARHPYSARTHINTIVNGILHVYRSREIRWIISFGIILGCVAKIWFFSYNPYFELVHISIKWFGVIFCVMNCIAWISSTYAESIEQHIGERNSILLLFSVITLPVICMGVFVHPALAAMVLLPNIMRGFIRPFKSDYINRRIGNEARSTILSTESAIVQLSGVISLYLFGIVLDHTSLPNALVILGLVALVLSYLNFKSYRKLAFVPH